jgi:hypothetical protein
VNSFIEETFWDPIREKFFLDELSIYFGREDLSRIESFLREHLKKEE